jgi:hypothetical protein
MLITAAAAAMMSFVEALLTHYGSDRAGFNVISNQRSVS